MNVIDRWAKQNYFNSSSRTVVLKQYDLKKERGSMYNINFVIF